MANMWRHSGGAVFLTRLSEAECMEIFGHMFWKIHRKLTRHRARLDP